MAYRDSAIIAEGRRRLIDDPRRPDGVTTISVDEHVWRHTPLGDKYVTVVINLIPTCEKTGPQDCWTWSRAAPRPPSSSGSSGARKRGGTESRGLKVAAAEELPDAVPGMDPFHGVRLAGDALDRCGQRVQQNTLGHRGSAGDPLYRARRTLHTGASLLADKQRVQIEAVFVIEEHVEVEATWASTNAWSPSTENSTRRRGRS